MHSARVGSGEDIIGQSATRGSLLLSIRSLYQSCMSVRMNAILGDRKQELLTSLEETETQTTLPSLPRRAAFFFRQIRFPRKTSKHAKRKIITTAALFPPFYNSNSLTALSYFRNNRPEIRKRTTVETFFFLPFRTKRRNSEIPPVHRES